MRAQGEEESDPRTGGPAQEGDGDPRTRGPAEEGGTGGTTKFAGEWGTRLDVDTAFEGESEDIVEATSYLDMGLEWDPRDDFRIVLQGQFRHWAGGKKNPDNTNLLLNARHPRASYDARLGEAYALWRAGDLTVGLGNIVSRWGSTDLTRPGDVINPTDQTTFSAMSAPERLPQLAVDLSYTGRGWSLQGLVVPFFAGDRVWAFGRDTSVFNPRNPIVRDQFPIAGLLDQLIDPSVQDDIQSLVSASRLPDEVPKNVSLGTRLTATFANADVGIGGWWGWDRTPFIHIDDDMKILLQTLARDGQVLQDFDFLQFFLRNQELVEVTGRISEKAAAGEELFFSEHRRLGMLLLDGARYIGPIGVRADVAMFAQKTWMTEGFRAVRRPTIAPSLGLSWERFESEDDVLTVTVEGFLNKPLAADDSLTKALVAEDERGSADDPLLIVDDGLYGVAGAALWVVPVVDVRLQVGGVYNVSHGDVIASLSAARTFWGWFEVGAGYTVFAGPSVDDRLTLGGLYDTNDHFSLAVSGIF